MRIFVLLLLGLGAALAIAAQATQTDRPIRVGASISRSGNLAAAGEMYEKGLKLWQRDVNAQGGLQGRQVELVLQDDASNPVKTAEIYAAFVDNGDTDLLLGPVDLRLALAIAPILERSQTPCIFPMPASATLWKGGKGLAFGVLAPLGEWPAGFFEIIARAGFERVALIAVDHPREKAVQANTAKWIKRYGLQLVSESMVLSKNVALGLDQARQANAEVITLWGTQEGCTLAIRALKNMAWKPKAVYASSTMFQHNLHELSTHDMNGVFTTMPWEARMAKTYPGGSDFVAAFRAAYSQEPEALAASAYACGQLLEAALNKAGGFSRKTLRQALTTLDTMTVMGRYGVDAGGMQLRQFPLTEQWQKGRREIVWPDELKTAKPVLPR